VADDLKHLLKDFYITEDLVEKILNVGPAPEGKSRRHLSFGMLFS
jgi:hypothetical protein